MAATSKPLKITIVGGGIGGLTAAGTLRKEGHEITILEKSLLKREIGAGISLGSPVARVLRNIGMDFRAAKAEVCKGFAVLTADGDAKLVSGLNSEEIFGEHWWTIHRVDLHNELRRVATDPTLPGPPAELRLGAIVKNVDVEEGIVTLETGETFHSDVIIGADGIHSVCRPHVVGPDSKPRPSGYAVYRALVPREAVMADPELAAVFDDPWLRIWISDKGNRTVTYWARDHEYLNFASVVTEKNLGRSEGYEGPGVVSEMAAQFKDFAPYIPRVLALAPSCGMWKLRDHEQTDHWVKGRCIIMGDAAHALLPHEAQGASQTIEDAEAIGAYLAPFTTTGTNKEEINDVLEQIATLRKPRAHYAQGYSRDSRAPWDRNPDGFRKFAADEKAIQEGRMPPHTKESAPSYGWSWYRYPGIIGYAKSQGLPLPKGMEA